MPAIMSSVEDVTIQLAAETAREADARAKKLALIVKAYQADSSLREIAQITGLSHENVRQILAAAGVELRGRGRPSKTDP